MRLREEAIRLRTFDIFYPQAKIIGSIYSGRMNLLYIWSFDVAIGIVQNFIIVVSPFVLWV